MTGTQLAQLTVFFDGCPTDWLVNGKDEQWHNLVYLLISPDIPFQDLVKELENQLPGHRFQKWGRGKKGRGYQKNFVKVFKDVWPNFKVSINAVSFQEKSIRSAKSVLLNEFNMGFTEYTDLGGREWMEHELVNFTGYHQINRLENQILPLLVMAWVTVKQFLFYRTRAIAEGCYDLVLILISDRLSGDDEIKQLSEEALRTLLNPDSNMNIILTSSRSGELPGDYLADNLAGWLNACVNAPDGKLAQHLIDVPSIENFLTWKNLVFHHDRIDFIPYLQQIKKN